MSMTRIMAARLSFSQQKIRGHVEQPCNLQHLLMGQRPFCTADEAGQISEALSRLDEISGKMTSSIEETLRLIQLTLDEAMRQAIGKLDPAPDLTLNDAVTIPGVDIKQVPIIKGDAKSISIGAASIVAKVTRDRMMVEPASA